MPPEQQQQPQLPPTPVTPQTPPVAPQPPVSQPSPSSLTKGGLKALTPENIQKSIRNAWLFAAASIVILLLGLFVTAIATPLGAILGAWALYFGIRLKQKGLIVAGSIGLLNLVVYLIVTIDSITS